MASVAPPVALFVALVNALVAALGAWRLWRGEQAGQGFWRGVRAGQAAAVVFALVCGALAAAGKRPDDALFWLYALLPLAVGLVAEQLRIAAAQSELDARGLPDAQAMAALSDGEQRAVVVAILRREQLVMTCAAAVVVFLALRAAGTA